MDSTRFRIKSAAPYLWICEREFEIDKYKPISGNAHYSIHDAIREITDFAKQEQIQSFKVHSTL